MAAAPSTASQVLRLLLEAEGPCSGQAMGEALSISRAAVSKSVAALRELGLVIDSKPRAGYQLISEPEAPLAARMEARLPPGSLGLPLACFESIDSTNLEARRRAEAGAPHGTCVVADFQKAGRGRMNRRWVAPPGTCLLFSVILRPAMAIYEVFGLTLLTSLAVCRAIEAMSGLTPQIKWPNDVYLENRKLAGVLTEFASRAEQVEHVVVGVGLNVNLDLRQLGRMDQPAASLSGATGQAWDRGLLLAEILGQVNSLYDDFIAGRADELRAAYQSRFMLADQRVKVIDGEQVTHGIARGLQADGALLLEIDSGEMRTIRHGDVSLRKGQSGCDGSAEDGTRGLEG